MKKHYWMLLGILLVIISTGVIYKLDKAMTRHYMADETDWDARRASYYRKVSEPNDTFLKYVNLKEGVYEIAKPGIILKLICSCGNEINCGYPDQYYWLECSGCGKIHTDSGVSDVNEFYALVGGIPEILNK